MGLVHGLVPMSSIFHYLSQWSPWTCVSTQRWWYIGVAHRGTASFVAGLLAAVLGRVLWQSLDHHPNKDVELEDDSHPTMQSNTQYTCIYIYMTIITSPKSTCIWLVSTSFNFPTLPYLKAAFTDQRFPGKARVAKQRWAQRSGVGSTAGDHQQCLCLMVPWRSLCNHLGQWRRRGWQQQSARTIEPLGKDTKNH